MTGFTRIRNFLIRLVLILLAFLSILLILGTILAGKYEESLKKWSVEKINQEVNTKISIEGMHASFLRTFPHVSIVLTKVIVWSSPSFNKLEFTGLNTDSLFTSEKVYLQFNAIDLLRSKMRIRRIFAENGNINLLVDSNGKTNYNILKEGSRDKEKKDEKLKVFELEALKLNGFNLELNNRSKLTRTSVSLDDLLLKGKFSGNNFSIGTNAGLVLHDFTRNGFRYANDYEIALRVIMEMNDQKATIRKGEVVLNTIRLNTTGNIALGEVPTLDLGMEARNFNLATLLSSLPQKIRAKIPFNVQGRGDIAIKVNGPITATKVPSIQSVYVLSLNQLSFQKESFRNIKLKGSYTNGERQRPSTTLIDIQKFRMNDRNSNTGGSLVIRNLVNPTIQLNIDGKIDASQLMAFIPEEKRIHVDGYLLPRFSFNATIESFGDIKPEILGTADLAGQLTLENINLLIGDLPEFRNINGKISFRDKSWYPDLSLVTGKSDLEIKARTGHIPEMFLGDSKTLNLQAMINSKYFDLEPFFGKSRDSKRENNSREGFSLPSFINGRLNCSIGEMNIGYFVMHDVEGIMVLAPGSVSIPEVSFRAMNGRAKGALGMRQDEGGSLHLKTDSYLQAIDIKQLFEGFNNFGQESLRAEHIGGTVTGNVLFNASFDSLFDIRNESIVTEAELVINNGELLHFDPLLKLSSFVDLEELEHIRFSTLKNTVLVSDKKMIIPEMDIRSNAFNISASGVHNFNGHFEYKVKILLSELLTSKAKNTRSEFYMMDEDRRASLYLSIAGTSDDYKIKYDKKEALTAIKNDLQKEKMTLKSILNEEFGLFSKDSTVKVPDATKKTGIIFQWDDDSLSDPAGNKPVNQKEENRKKKKNRIVAPGQEEDFELDWDDDGG